MALKPTGKLFRRIRPGLFSGVSLCASQLPKLNFQGGKLFIAKLFEIEHTGTCASHGAYQFVDLQL